MKEHGYQILVAVPTLNLGEDLFDRFIKAGLDPFDVQLYRGRNAADPTSPEDDRKQACLLPYTSNQMASSGGSVAKSVCSTCPLADQCFYMSQQALEPTVWIVAHNLLTLPSDILPENPFIFFIDEDSLPIHIEPAKRGIARKKVKRSDGSEHDLIANDSGRLLESQINMVAALPDDEKSELELGTYRDRVRRLVANIKRGNERTEVIEQDDDGYNVRVIIEAQKGGYVTRQALADAGLTLDDVEKALQIERVARSIAAEGADKLDIKAGQVGGRWLDEVVMAEYNYHAQTWVDLWQELVAILSPDEDIYVWREDDCGNFVGKDLLHEGDGDFIDEVGRIYVDDAGNLFLTKKNEISDNYTKFVVAVDATPSMITTAPLTGDPTNQ